MAVVKITQGRRLTIGKVLIGIGVVIMCFFGGALTILLISAAGELADDYYNAPKWAYYLIPTVLGLLIYWAYYEWEKNGKIKDDE